MTLKPQIVAQQHLDPSTREEMLALHQRNFAGVCAEKFFADLGEKDWVIVLRNVANRVVGFSTQQLIANVLGADNTKFLFSGDTIVSPEHWNTPYLSGCFGHLMLHLMDTHPDTPLYWFLISKGFRTYRFLPVFFNHFWPNPNVATPSDITALFHAVAKHKFCHAFDPASGIIRDPAGDRLTPELAEIPVSKRSDTFIRFFLDRNPHYADGDELACLAPITRSNLNILAQRVIRQTQPEWV